MLQAIESLPNALIIYDAAWRIKAFNHQAAQLLNGLGEETCIALEQLITQTIPAAYLLKVPQNPAESRTPCSNQYTTTKLIDGKSQLVSYHLAFNLTTENDEVLVYLSITDLSAYAAIHQELHHQNVLMRTALDETPDVIVMKDWEGNFILVNQAVAHLYDATPEEMIGKEDGYFTGNQEQAQFFKESVQQIMTKFETEVVIEDSTNAETGEVRHFQSIKKPLLDEKGNKQILVIAHDITDIVTAQKQIEDSEKRLNYVMQATQEGVWDWHIPSGALTHNRQWFKILAYEESDLTHMMDDFVQCLLPEDQPKIMEKIQACFRGEAPYVSEHQMRRRDGKLIWVYDRGNIVERDEQGNPIRMVGSFAEITDRKLAEVKLQEEKLRADAANQAKSEFLANMSHEIRTPMNGVIGMTDLLLDSPVTPETRQALEIIRQSGQSLMSIINDILDFSKIEAGKVEIEKTPFSLVNTANGLLVLLKPAAMAKNLVLNLEFISSDLDWILGDEQKLKQILTNLMGNAIKFTQKGTITLLLEKIQVFDGEILKVSVRDTGVGLSKEDQTKLFKPFSQVDASTTRKFGGTGLGLSICKRLTELMGGEIGVDSEPQAGATFWITLPLNQVAAVLPKAPMGAQTLNTDLSNLKVLVVEDNIVNRKVIEALLKKFGCQYVSAENGLQALDKLQENEVDLVLMDCQMPVMDGYEASKQIRAGKAGAQNRLKPIVALTANVLDEDRQMCFASGMDDFLGKPINLQALKLVLQKFN
ncbi:PAS domain-containing hybrid sensor histidine kinase/response regulator [Thiosulfativibrio zosterae]|uniref:Sensory/regulatory protein RpfC n=1 Tax=Thiosulfativibrio zosterae TaxID=2675053 RepID=A0A6F8PPW9_9GAMM|nr:PAS domain-containing hybrid sensor histidine kinase/response regulator [Thiosulfativibrio zosterae]BBP44084.1 hypothetical protein THMIRHAT_18300 [Thiosulfativibrio zosterae]